MKERNWCVKQVKRFDEIKVLKIRHKAVLYLIAFIQFCVYPKSGAHSRRDERIAKENLRIITSINPIYLHYKSKCL